MGVGEVVRGERGEGDRDRDRDREGRVDLSCFSMVDEYFMLQVDFSA
jgi:hypothetical protein